jgi:Fe-S-cluster-containing hydrogenase component 2
MMRKIITIDSEKCNGCGSCAEACHEGAIGMVDGKAKLLREDYCDGLGNCLPVCPMNAISFEEREAADYDGEAVKRRLVKREVAKTVARGCPGSNAYTISREEQPPVAVARGTSALRQWPVQIKLAPVGAPYFDNANLLIAADCAAYAHNGFHGDFMQGKITLVGCPKLDGVDYSEKLTEIIARNNVKSVTVVRIEVPCCGGIEQAVVTALKNSEKMIPWRVVILSTKGDVLQC